LNHDTCAKSPTCLLSGTVTDDGEWRRIAITMVSLSHKDGPTGKFPAQTEPCFQGRSEPDRGQVTALAHASQFLDVLSEISGRFFGGSLDKHLVLCYNCALLQGGMNCSWRPNWGVGRYSILRICKSIISRRASFSRLPTRAPV